MRAAGRGVVLDPSPPWGPIHRPAFLQWPQEWAEKPSFRLDAAPKTGEWRSLAAPLQFGGDQRDMRRPVKTYV